MKVNSEYSRIFFSKQRKLQRQLQHFFNIERFIQTKKIKEIAKGDRKPKKKKSIIQITGIYLSTKNNEDKFYDHSLMH